MTTAAFATIRPRAEEHAPYYERYVKRVPDGSILDTLARQRDETIALFEGLDAERARYRYAPDKWAVLDVLGHVIDSERIFSYRALRAARGDETDLPGYDENTYAPIARYVDRPLADVVEEFRVVRAASLALFKGLDEAAWDRTVTANGSHVSVRGLAWILAGHELHHRAVLSEKYGLGAEAKRG
jgi:hypothetical protein